MDDFLRHVERLVATGELDAEATLLARRIQAGHLSVGRALLAARLGHGASSRLFSAREMKSRTTELAAREEIIAWLAPAGGELTSETFSGIMIDVLLGDSQDAIAQAHRQACIEWALALDPERRRVHSVDEDPGCRPESDIRPESSGFQGLLNALGEAVQRRIERDAGSEPQGDESI